MDKGISEMNSCQHYKKWVITLLASTSLLFIYLFIFYILAQTREMSYIKIYVGGCVVFVLSFYLFMRLMYPTLQKVGSFNDRVLAIIILILFCSFGALAYWFEEIGTWDDYYQRVQLRHMLPICLYAPLLILAVQFTHRIVCKHNINYPKPIRIVISIVVVVLETYLLYIPNFLGEPSTTSYHIHAYTNSIINVQYHIPYSPEVNSIYGHYGIIYYIPVKILRLLFSNRWLGITLTVALFGGISFCLEQYVINKMIKNDFLFALASIAVAMPMFSEEFVQYQMIPHRYLFIDIALAGCCYTLCHERRTWIDICMWILGFVSVLWNLESGIIFLCLWVTCKPLKRKLYDGHWKIHCSIFDIIISIVDIVGAYITVNVYNYVVGGRWLSVSEFIFPIKIPAIECITSGASNMESNILGGFITSLQREFKGPYENYFLILVVFLGTLSIAFAKLLRRDFDYSTIMILVSSIAGIGTLLIFFNYMDEGKLVICNVPFVVVVTMLLDRCISSKSIEVKTLSCEGVLSSRLSVAICLTAVLVAMSIESGLSVSRMLEKKYYTVQNRDDIEKLSNWIRGQIPDETVCLGECAPELFAYINEPPGIYAMDWSDMGPVERNYVSNMIDKNNYEYILVRDINEDIIPDNYAKTNGFCNDFGATFRLYQRIQDTQGN